MTDQEITDLVNSDTLTFFKKCKSSSLVGLNVLRNQLIEKELNAPIINSMYASNLREMFSFFEKAMIISNGENFRFLPHNKIMTVIFHNLYSADVNSWDSYVRICGHSFALGGIGTELSDLEKYVELETRENFEKRKETLLECIEAVSTKTKQYFSYIDKMLLSEEGKNYDRNFEENFDIAKKFTEFYYQAAKERAEDLDCRLKFDPKVITPKTGTPFEVFDLLETFEISDLLETFFGCENESFGKIAYSAMTKSGKAYGEAYLYHLYGKSSYESELKDRLMDDTESAILLCSDSVIFDPAIKEDILEKLYRFLDSERRGQTYGTLADKIRDLDRSVSYMESFSKSSFTFEKLFKGKNGEKIKRVTELSEEIKYLKGYVKLFKEYADSYNKENHTARSQAIAKYYNRFWESLKSMEESPIFKYI